MTNYSNTLNALDAMKNLNSITSKNTQVARTLRA